MDNKNNFGFCTKCRKETEYTLGKYEVIRIRNGIPRLFILTSAICNECGEEMPIPGLINKNVQEIDEQCRKLEDLVSINDIKKLIDICKCEERTLSLALGFEATTISNYLLGQIPSKENSDIIRATLSLPNSIIEKINKIKKSR